MYAAFSLAAEPAESYAVAVASIAVSKFWSVLARTLYWFNPASCPPNAVRSLSLSSSQTGLSSLSTSYVLFKLPSVLVTTIPYSSSASAFLTIRDAMV